MSDNEESAIPIPKINPNNFNTYVNQYLTAENLKDAAITFVIKDANVAGLKGFLHLPYDCDISGYSLLADVAGNVVIDIWKAAFAAFPPTVANTITAAAKPTLAAAQGVLSTAIGTWTTALNAGDVVAVNVDSTLTLTEVTVTIFVTKRV